MLDSKRKFKAEKNSKNKKALAQIFFAGVRKGADSRGTNEVRLRDEEKLVGQRLNKGQCAHCQE